VRSAAPPAHRHRARRAAALDKYDLETCVKGHNGRSNPRRLRATRGGGGKVCDTGGTVTKGSVVKDGSAMSILVFSQSEKVLKDFAPAFEAAVAAIADWNPASFPCGEVTSSEHRTVRKKSHTPW
jgi:hypothetical protein